MPKLKTHKRMSSHLRRKKPTKVTRKYADKLLVDESDIRRLSRLLPYR